MLSNFNLGMPQFNRGIAAKGVAPKSVAPKTPVTFNHLDSFSSIHMNNDQSGNTSSTKTNGGADDSDKDK